MQFSLSKAGIISDTANKPISIQHYQTKSRYFQATGNQPYINFLIEKVIMWFLRSTYHKELFLLVSVLRLML